MLRFFQVFVFIIFGGLASHAQNINVSPEIVLGNRSAAYQHFIGYQFDASWSINNVVLFDSEYTHDTNNIFFIRNMLSYNLNSHFKVNAAFGIKNPGTFTSLTTQYQYTKTQFKLTYAIGSTYQNGFTLEQNLILNYTPTLSNAFQGYINLFAVVNANFKELDRGIQQLRIGLKKAQLIAGIAVNLDQFTKGKNTLENFGVFIKYNF